VAVHSDPRIGKNKLVKILNDHQIMPHIVQDRIVDVPPIVRNIRTAVIGLWERRNTPALTGSEVVEAQEPPGIRFGPIHGRDQPESGY
jgi:hypothetical protein